MPYNVLLSCQHIIYHLNRVIFVELVGDMLIIYQDITSQFKRIGDVSLIAINCGV